MAKLISLPNNRCDLKFGVKPKKFNRIEKVKCNGAFYEFYIDRNDSVYEVLECTVVTWKTIEKGRKKFNVPDEIRKVRNVELFNSIKGNPFKIALSYVNNRFA